MITDEQSFLNLIAKIAKRSGYAEATLSTMIFGDGKKVSALRNGSTLTVRRLNDALRYCREHWPEITDAALQPRRNSRRAD